MFGPIETEVIDLRAAIVQFGRQDSFQKGEWINSIKKSKANPAQPSPAQPIPCHLIRAE